MSSPRRESHPIEQQEIWVVFDLRYPDATERLHRERAAFQGDGDMEVLDQGHFVLIVRPGGARRLAT
jgi:hypothetical protein